MFVTEPIPHFLHHFDKNLIAVATIENSIRLLHGGRTSHFSLKIPISCCISDPCYIPAEIQLIIETRNVYLNFWDEIMIFLRYCKDLVDQKIEMTSEFAGHLKQILFCSLATVESLILY